MRITIVSVVKNSADIIETFIRANGLYADNFIIINNNSTDRTIEILKHLINEGFKIDIVEDTETAHLQSMKMNILISNIKSIYDPDWIVPLDDDEILISHSNNSDVRSIFESLDDTKLHYARWRNYLPSEHEIENERCILKKETICFSSIHKTLNKVILSRNNLNGNTLIVQGNHDVVNCDAEKEYLNDLVIAHYPVRSKEQIISKALVGWTNTLAMPNNSKNNGWHWREMYEKVKNGCDLSIDDLWSICALYIEDLNEQDLTLESNPLVLDPAAYTIKYTYDNETDPWKNYINNVEQLAKNYSNLKNQI